MQTFFLWIASFLSPGIITILGREKMFIIMASSSRKAMVGTDAVIYKIGSG